MCDENGTRDPEDALDLEVNGALEEDSGVNEEFVKESQVRDSQVREAQPDYNKRYTYADYLTWDYEDRWELIDGVPYMMAAPNRWHQEFLGNLSLLIGTFLKGKPCKMYFAPLDVRLNSETLDNTVVQPDLIVVCDHSILDDAGCKGVPDLAVEILSPSTSHYDKTIKFNTYLKVGLREFWIIDPVKKTLAVNILVDGSYITHVYTENDIVNVHVLEGCKIDLAEVFED